MYSRQRKRTPVTCNRIQGGTQGGVQAGEGGEISRGDSRRGPPATASGTMDYIITKTTTPTRTGVRRGAVSAPDTITTIKGSTRPPIAPYLSSGIEYSPTTKVTTLTAVHWPYVEGVEEEESDTKAV